MGQTRLCFSRAGTTEMDKMAGEAGGAAGNSQAPAIERDGTGWICRDRSTGNVLPNFEGVAYCEDLGVFVQTYKSGTERGLWELGAQTYEGALAESEEFKKQMPLQL